MVGTQLVDNIDISSIPLEEIIAESLDVGTGTKKVVEYYERLISVFGNEFSVLLNAPIDNIAAQ